MLNRLKTLPLTIILTILIWMYAEAQFTFTRDDVPITLRIASPSPDLTIRALDAHGNPLGGGGGGGGGGGAIVTITATLQGPKSQIDRIFEQSQGGGALSSPDTSVVDELSALTYTPPASKLQPTTQPAGPAGATTANTIDTVAMLNRLSYFRRRNVIIASANPATLRLDVDTIERLARTPEFRPAVPLDHTTLTPEQVTINIPSRLFKEIGGGRAVGGADKITVTAVPLRDLALLPPDTDQTIPVRFTLDYPATRDPRITVTPPQGSVTLHVPRRQGITEVVPDVPVFISGPPARLASCEVDLKPKSVRITVVGAPAAIQSLRQQLASSTPGNPTHNIRAYLDILPDDRPTPDYLTRRLRYSLPEGLTLQQAPADLEFRLTESTPTTQPTTNH